MHGVVHFVQEILVVLAASLAAVLVLGKMRLPSIVGYLAAGIAVGPRGLGFVEDEDLIETMAEVGVVLLMFTIGLKFSIAELTKMRRLVFVAGAIQVAVTVGAAVAIAAAFDVPPAQGVFLGFLLAMSSTAIVLKLLEEKAETESAHGRIVTGVLIFQDLAVVPCMLLVPMLAGRGGTVGDAALGLGKSFVLVAIMLVTAKFLLPRVFAFVAKSRNREVFTLATVLVILATAGAAGLAGLSLALGALVAGVVLSESDYATQLLSDVAPMRDLLASLFFVSVGMLVDASGWVREPLVTVGLTAAVLLVKGLIVWGIALSFGLGPRIGALAALALAQIGEFSFVLAATGREIGLLDGETNGRFLSVSVLSMALTPFLLLLGPWLSRRTSALPAGHGTHAARSGHVIVVGYGITGRNTTGVLRGMQVPVLVLELNTTTVRRLRADGIDAEFGDASRDEVLEHAGIRGARAVVLTALDPVATRQTVATARRLNPSVKILVRTRFVAEMPELRRLGADVVVPEEFEASIALAGYAMQRFGATDGAIAKMAATLRSDGYGLLQDEGAGARREAMRRILEAAELDEVEVPPAAVGKTLRTLDLRRRTGALVVAIRRGEELLPNPGADLPFASGDLLVVAGKPPEFEALRAVLSGGSPASG